MFPFPLGVRKVMYPLISTSIYCILCRPVCPPNPLTPRAPSGLRKDAVWTGAKRGGREGAQDASPVAPARRRGIISSPSSCQRVLSFSPPTQSHRPTPPHSLFTIQRLPLHAGAAHPANLIYHIFLHSHHVLSAMRSTFFAAGTSIPRVFFLSTESSSLN